MARINIEDSIYTDGRFVNLILKTQSMDLALGAMVRAWTIAQQWFLNEQTGGGIPVNEWQKQGINNLIIEVGLARVDGNLVHVSGAAKQFEWLAQKQLAGKKSAETKKSRFNENQHTLNSVERTSTHVESRSTEEHGAQPLTLSPSLSLPHSQALNTPLTPQGDRVGESLDTRSAEGKSAEELYRNGKAKVKLDQVIELYNEILAGVGKLRHVRDVGHKTRMEFLDSLDAYPTLDHWKVVFELVRNSKKLTGQVETTWVANFSWLAVKENALKVEQGAYDDDFEDSKKKAIEKNLKDLELK